MKQERTPCKSRDREESHMISECEQGDGSPLNDEYSLYRMRTQGKTNRVNCLQTLQILKSSLTFLLSHSMANHSAYSDQPFHRYQELSTFTILTNIVSHLIYSNRLIIDLAASTLAPRLDLLYLPLQVYTPCLYPACLERWKTFMGCANGHPCTLASVDHINGHPLVSSWVWPREIGGVRKMSSGA